MAASATMNVNGNDELHLDDDGWKVIRLGDSPPVRVDFVAVHNRRIAIERTYRDDNGGEIPKYQEMIADLFDGLQVSAGLAIRFVNAIDGLVADLAKKNAITPASPGSTT